MDKEQSISKLQRTIYEQNECGLTASSIQFSGSSSDSSSSYSGSGEREGNAPIPTVGPIAHTAKWHAKLMCVHEATNCQVSLPNTFIRFPYKPSLMTLLRRVETKQCDAVGYRINTQDPPIVYAGFQNHWHVQVNHPVLTIVGTCNTNIDRPMFTRTQFAVGQLTFQISTTREQHSTTFDIPMYIHQQQSDRNIVLQSTFSNDLADQLTSYILHPSDGHNPIMRINVWNLSTIGCHRLHVSNLLQPHRVDPRHEVHILGLTGKVDRIFCPTNFSFENQLIQMLDEEDLVAIGYRDTKHVGNLPHGHKKPRMYPTDDLSDRNLLNRLSPQKATYYSPYKRHLMEVPAREISMTNRKFHTDPEHYPPPRTHKETNIEKKPDLFPPGHFTFQRMPVPPHITVNGIIHDIEATFHIPRESAIKYIAKHYGISVEIILLHQEDLFVNIIPKEELVDYETLQKIFSLQHNIPKHWLRLEVHPILKYKNVGTSRLAQENVEADHYVQDQTYDTENETWSHISRKVSDELRGPLSSNDDYDRIDFSEEEDELDIDRGTLQSRENTTFMAEKLQEIRLKDLQIRQCIKDLIKAKELERSRLQRMIAVNEKKIAQLTLEAEQHRREGWPDDDFDSSDSMDETTSPEATPIEETPQGEDMDTNVEPPALRKPFMPPPPPPTTPTTPIPIEVVVNIDKDDKENKERKIKRTRTKSPGRLIRPRAEVFEMDDIDYRPSIREHLERAERKEQKRQTDNAVQKERQHDCSGSCFTI